MARYKIVFTDYYYPDIAKEIAILQRLGDVEIVDCTKIAPGGIRVEARIIELASEADALIVQFARITRSVIAGLRRCRVIARYAIGVDTIDVEAAREKGIAVANVPDYCIEEVSDAALAHILNCARKVTLSNNLLRAGEWAFDRVRPIRRFKTLTIGLVGFGHIARRLAEKLAPFGNRIVAYDPFVERGSVDARVELLPLEELLRGSDVVSIHVPLTAQTRRLIDRRMLALLRPGAILVNTSRGAVVDEGALADALRSGRIAAAGLDVLDCSDEAYPQSPLAAFPAQVLITPHIGWYSEESIAELQQKTALNVFEALANGKPLYQV